MKSLKDFIVDVMIMAKMLPKVLPIAAMAIASNIIRHLTFINIYKTVLRVEMGVISTHSY
jgi:hypothetical protein